MERTTIDDSLQIVPCSVPGCRADALDDWRLVNPMFPLCGVHAAAISPRTIRRCQTLLEKPNITQNAQWAIGAALLKSIRDFTSAAPSN